MKDNSVHSCYTILQVENSGDKNRFIKTWHCSWIGEGYALVDDNIIEKYALYDSFSDDFLLLKTNQPIGTLRIINQNDVVGLPVFNDFAIEKEFDKNERLCEATLLTVKKSERQAGYLPTYILLIQLWRYVRANNISGIVIAADRRLWVLLTRIFALRFTKIGQERMYEGSVTVPGYLSVREQKECSMKSPPCNILQRAFQEI